MDFYDVVRSRRSIRAYKPAPIEPEKLDRILQAGRLAPSACNLQPWAFLLVTDPGTRKDFIKVYKQPWLCEAPVILVICADTKKAWKRWDGQEYWQVDCAIAMQNMISAATAEGLGTCWIAAFDEPACVKLLNLPAHIRPVVITPIGYAAETKDPVADRLPLEDILHRERW
ncbi:MAG: nitroreductase [Actinobacteria bacterium]|nr:nitroreductase [Actinomycetota bacterium]